MTDWPEISRWRRSMRAAFLPTLEKTRPQWRFWARRRRFGSKERGREQGQVRK
uniref:Uncharacterized protein n=1 Tax=Arundo donax TaxID=35708 RepID=A0A0A8YLX9_ARUDO